MLTPDGTVHGANTLKNVIQEGVRIAHAAEVKSIAMDDANHDIAQVLYDFEHVVTDEKGTFTATEVRELLATIGQKVEANLGTCIENFEQQHALLSHLMYRVPENVAYQPDYYHAGDVNSPFRQPLCLTPMAAQVVGWYNALAADDYEHMLSNRTTIFHNPDNTTHA